MDSNNVPRICIDNSRAISPEAEKKWRSLVGKNLGPEVEGLYQENTNIHIFEPARLVREGLEQAVQLFSAELRGKDKRKAPDMEKLQTFDDVAEAVKTAAETWANRKRYFPQVQDKLVDFLNSASHYQKLAAIFPTQSQYTSTFCAALKILITAATNYRETAEGLAKALQEITAAAKNVSDLNALFDTEEMRRYVINFYASILKFCWVAINWYQSKTRRILGNFKDNLYAEVNEIVTSIKANAETIKETAAKGNLAETRVMHAKMDHQGEVIKQDLEELKRQTWANHIFLMYIFQQKQPQSGGIRRTHNRKARRFSKSPGRKSSRADSCSDENKENPDERPIPRTYSQRETTNSARDTFDLADQDPKKQIKACLRASGKNFASEGKKFRERINSWMTENCSSILWVQGDPGIEKISITTSFAAQIINSALFAGIRVIFHLCTFHARESEQHPVVYLVKSLILQLLESEEVDFETDIDLSEARFRRVEESFHAAWDLFDDVITLSSAQTIFVAIDCLERFDEDPNCELLMQRLKDLSTTGPRDKVVKLLLTSKRNTTCIFDRLPGEVKLRLRSRPRSRTQRSGKRYNWRQRGRTPPATAEPTNTDESEPNEESEVESEVESEDGSSKRRNSFDSFDSSSLGGSGGGTLDSDLDE